MKKIFCAIFVVVVTMMSAVMFACQTASAHAENVSSAAVVHEDDNGASGTGYGSINDPTPKAPLATSAETGEPINDKPGEAFALAYDVHTSYNCNPEDAPDVCKEPNDDLGPGDDWWDNYSVSSSEGGKY